jgi:fatty-acyl-CoA synthase
MPADGVASGAAVGAETGAAEAAVPFADWIHAHAARHGDAPALRGGDAVLGWATFARRIDAVAAALAAAGVASGAVVAWLGLNSTAMLATLWACARRGAVFMPLNWRLAPPEHRAMLHEAEPALFVADAGFAAASVAAGAAPPATRCVVVADPPFDADAGAEGAAAAAAAIPAGWQRWDDFVVAGAGARVLARGPEPSTAPAHAPDPSAALLLCYTSGSTGRPKGVLLSADALAANADASDAMHGLVAADRVLTTLPLFHVGGLNILTTPALRAGASVTLHAKFDPDAAFDAIERDRITLTVLVPAQLEAMLAHRRWAGADLSSLRSISTGSTVVPRRLIDAVQARGVPLIQVWGATETAPIASALQAADAARKTGSAGRAAAGVQLRIVDAAGADAAPGASGEILVRGRSVMSAYWRDPDASARALADGWFHSGDSGHLDAEGFLWVDGRLKDMIISGGENVSPAEVEAVLLDDPGVAEVAVVGQPDARWGEVVVAVVVPRAAGAPSAERLLARFDGRLARFKHPKALLFVDALPRTALGKVRKEDVRGLAARMLQDRAQGVA